MSTQRLVICEDEATLQTVIRGFLRGTDYEVHMASNGVEGLALIERIVPAVIITDISMPGFDGFVLAAMIRAIPLFKTTPIIFVTGFAQKADKEEAAKYSPVDFLVKPFKGVELRSRIASMLAENCS